MKTLLTTLILLAGTFSLIGQEKSTIMKTIEVTGEASGTIDPDEIIFSITIEEYWKEEFEGKKYEDYKTKIEIEGIEQSLIEELKSLNIGMDQITLKQTGNYWRQRGKDFLVSKTLELSLSDFAKANEIANSVQTRGVRNMFVSKLKHKDLDQFKLKMKAQALKNAQEKAVFMAAALGKTVKGVVTIVEVDPNMNVMPRPQPMAYSRTAAMAESAPAVEYENYRKIEAKAVVRVLFEME